MTEQDPTALEPAEATLAEAEREGLGHLGRRLLVPIVLGILALVGLAVVADARELAANLGEFDLRLLVPVLALSLVNYGLRFARWEIYLRSLEVTLPWRTSLAVFLVGFVLSITPGKAGELGKAWLARELGGGKARRAVAAVIAERITDLLGMVLLAGLGALAFPWGRWPAVAAFVLSGLAVAILAWASAARRILALAERLPGLGNRVEILEEVYDRFRSLLRAPILAASLALSVLAWGAEGIGFAIVAGSYAPGASWLAAVFNYSASTLIGALSMLPGGLLASEGSLTALLGAQGLDTAAAASATLLIRAATLWFAVFLGLLAVPVVLRKLRGRG